MTKLFSIKSLACAGAAAFALTLAAAPQANAAEAAPKLTATVDYQKGILTVKGTGANDKNTIKTADGIALYIGSGKDATAAAKKLSLITDNNGTVENLTGDKGLSFDISNMLGKSSTIVVALDAEGTGISDAVTLAASPSLKATLENGDVKVEINKTKIEKTLADAGFTGYAYQYKMGAYGQWSTADTETDKANADILEAIKDAQVLGSTMYVRVAAYSKLDNAGSATYNSPWSKEAKVKIPAKAKAPKISVKTASLTKPFEWKIGDKYEYRVTTAYDSKSSTWTKGGDKADWSQIITAAKSQGKDNEKDADLTSGNEIKDLNVAKLVNGDAIAGPITIQLRTADNGKKAASNISVLKLAASINSPTKNEIAVVATTSKKKGATASAAAITPKTIPEGYEAQYSTDGEKKWKKLTKETIIESDKLNNKTVAVRLVSSDKKKTILPSAVTTLTIPENGTEGKGKVKSEGWTVSANTWAEANKDDYNA